MHLGVSGVFCISSAQFTQNLYNFTDEELSGTYLPAFDGLHAAFNRLRYEWTKLPDLSPLGKVVAITREEGSGTRAEFDTMLSTKELAQEYMQLNPRAQVSVVVTDSSSGLTSAIRRECDFAISSRELKS